MMNSVGTAPAVAIERLRVVRGGRVVLHDVCATVPRGSLVGLLGPSGCGKTTLLRSVVGVQVLAGGRVDVLGMRAGSAALRQKIGYVTQAPAVYPDLTARQNLRYFAALLGRGRRAVDEVLDDVALAHAGDQLVADMSGGQRARVSLAAALLGRPELLVLDEPTVGLDPVLRISLWQLFGELVARGTTLIVSSHVMDEAERCERLILMRDGRILADESPGELLRRTGAGDVEDAFLRIVRRDEVTA